MKKFNQLNTEEILDLISEENIKKLNKNDAREILKRANQLSNLYRANLLKAEKAHTILEPRILASQKKKESFRDYSFSIPKVKGRNERNVYISKLTRIRDFLKAGSHTVQGAKEQLKDTAKLLQVSEKELLRLSQKQIEDFWETVQKVQKSDTYNKWVKDTKYTSTQLVREIYSIRKTPQEVINDLWKYASKKTKEEIGEKENVDLTDVIHLTMLFSDKAEYYSDEARNERQSSIETLEKDILGGSRFGGNR